MFQAINQHYIGPEKLQRMRGLLYPRKPTHALLSSTSSSIYRPFMLGKILLTLSVIAIAYVYVRQRQLAESGENSEKISTTQTKKDESIASVAASKSELANDFRIAAYLFLGLMTLIGGGLYYFQWQDDHTVLTVNLHRENQSQPVSYRVYKYQLLDRSFITIDGTVVTVAGSERMEVIGLEN